MATKNETLEATLQQQTVDSSQNNKRGSLTVRSFWKIQKNSFKLTRTSLWRQRVPREKAADWSGHSRLLVEEPQGMGSTTIFQTATALFQISAVQEQKLTKSLTTWKTLVTALPASLPQH